MKIFWSKNALEIHDLQQNFDGFALGVDGLAREIVEYAYKSESLGMLYDLLNSGNLKIFQAIRTAIYNFEPLKDSLIYKYAVKAKPEDQIKKILSQRSHLADLVMDCTKDSMLPDPGIHRPQPDPELKIGGCPVKLHVFTAGTSPDFTVKYQASNDKVHWRDIDPGTQFPDRFIRTLMEGVGVAGSPRIIPKVRRDVRPGEILKFNVGEERYGGYQVRIFVNDPVTYCEIKRKGEVISASATIRSPKDSWNGKTAITKSLYGAVNLFTYNPEVGEDKAAITLFFDALFKKYPELKG